jgi:hypothetical protein
VIAQDHRLVRAEVLHQPLALGELDRRAFVVVVADVALEADRRLADRKQAALHRRHRHAGARVRMQDAGHVAARAVDRAVDDVAGAVHVVVAVGLPDHLAVEIDLGEARGGDLLVRETVQVDEDMMPLVALPSGDASRDVVVGEVGHPVVVDQAIAGREIHSGLPFLGADLALDGTEVGLVSHECKNTAGAAMTAISKVVAGFLVSLVFAGLAGAQPYPSKPGAARDPVSARRQQRRGRARDRRAAYRPARPDDGRRE